LPGETGAVLPYIVGPTLAVGLEVKRLSSLTYAWTYGTLVLRFGYGGRRRNPFPLLQHCQRIS